MPSNMMKRVGMSVAKGEFVLIAGIHCNNVVNVMKQTTTFLYCNSSTMGRKVKGV